MKPMIPYLKPILRSRVFLLFLSTAITLLLGELVLRMFFHVWFLAPAPSLSEATWRELIHRASPVPGLAYEMAPNMEKDVYGVPIKTNSLGMRDDEPRADRPASLVRVAVLGDSFTFGYKVPVEQAYPSVLERLLEASPKANARHYEVLNFGVLGYGTWDEALVLEHKALPLDPDAIVIGYVLNDPMPAEDEALHLCFTPPRLRQHFHLYRLAAAAWLKWRIKTTAEGDYHRYYHLADSPAWKDTLAALARIEQLAGQRRVPVLLVIFPSTPRHRWEDYPFGDLHARIAEAAQSNGFQVLDLFDVYSHYPPETIRRTEQDIHPSQFAHELAAKAILQELCSAHPGLFPRLEGSSARLRADGESVQIDVREGNQEDEENADDPPDGPRAMP